MAVVEQIDILDEVKADLVQKIRETNDRGLLGEVFCCIEDYVPQEKTILSHELMEQLDKDIEQSRKDYAEGRWITQEQLDEKLVQCQKAREESQQVDTLNELKVEVFQRIAEIDNLSVIREVVNCLENVAPKKHYVFFQEDKEIINQRIKSIEMGNVIPHEVVNKEVEEWLNNLANASR